MDDLFQKWHELKFQIHSEKVVDLFKAREIWWVRVGQNVGYEVFGKSEDFTRPVIILRKVNRHIFFGLPLTSRRKHIPSHYPFDLQGKNGSILLDQGRTFDARRLSKKILVLNEAEFERIKKAFSIYINDEMP